jgi:hypothetical protein
MKKMAAALVQIAKELTAVPMAIEAPTMSSKRWAQNTLMMALRVDKTWKQIFDAYLTVEEGTSNKFHYFGVFLNTRTGECVGGNSYGRIGYNPKAIEVARGSQGSVMSAVRAKVDEKIRGRGYQYREV